MQAAPVAEVHENGGQKWARLLTDLPPGTMLYASPAPQAPVVLTDEQVLEVVQRIDPHHQYLPSALRQFARAIEAAHGITQTKEPKA